MSIKITKSGIQDSFRAAGRTGIRSSGVNPTGAEDPIAHRLGAELLGNSIHKASLEFFLPGPTIEFQGETAFVITGSAGGAKLDHNPINANQVYCADNGAALELPASKRGRVGYLHVKGGFELDEWAGSETTNTFAKRGGYEGRVIRAGDVIDFSDPIMDVPMSSSTTFVDYENNLLRFVKGSDFPCLTAISELDFLTSEFLVTKDSNRMGIKLAGPKLGLLDDESRLSSGVNQGTIQLLPNGSLIVLMSDHQTTGGYPVVGTLSPRSVSILAQKTPGEEITFTDISAEDARKEWRQVERDFSLLRVGRKFLRH